MLIETLQVAGCSGWDEGPLNRQFLTRKSWGSDAWDSYEQISVPTTLGVNAVSSCCQVTLTAYGFYLLLAVCSQVAPNWDRSEAKLWPTSERICDGSVTKVWHL